MHELSLTQSIVQICEEASAGRPVRSISLEIGELSGVLPDAVQFCFTACARGTTLDGASLVIEVIPAQGRCRKCGAESAISNYSQVCKTCGAFGLNITKGKELRVKEIELA